VNDWTKVEHRFVAGCICFEAAEHVFFLISKYLNMDFEKLLSEIRYELIADYPYNKHALYNVFIIDEISEKQFYSKYPAVFKKLQWWERRNINELPQYLIDNYDTKQRVIRASKHWASFLPDGKTMVEDKTMFISGAKAIPYWSCRPCTKSEYELQNQ
jgi:hypothetical protein